MSKYRVFTAQAKFEDINGNVRYSKLNEFRSFPLNFQRWQENYAYENNLNLIEIVITIKK